MSVRWPDGGGRYLPGHDSRHLRRLFQAVADDTLGLDEALAEVELNPALQAKLRKRLGLA